LTANLQLQPCHNRHTARLVIRGRLEAASGSRSPRRPREGCTTVLAEPRSTAPPRCTSRSAVFSTACRACDTASDVLCHDPPRIRTAPSRERPHPHRFGSPGPPLPAVSSKTAASGEPGRLPSPSAPSPGRVPRFRAVRVGSRGARHRCRCSRARGFHHRDPASGAASPSALTRLRVRARWLDP
jgi:hypothetical protein